MSRREKRKTDKERVAEGKALLASMPKLSETMLEFGAPFLALLPSPPALEELRRAMMVVTVAWNLPLYEKRRHPQAASFRATFEQMLAQLPPDVAKILESMLYSRLVKYANDPRTGFAEVVEDGHGRANVSATAALTEDWVGA